MRRTVLDPTTNELRARGWQADPAIVYGCGCVDGKLCTGHAERRAVEHHHPEAIPPHRIVSGQARISTRGPVDRQAEHFERAERDAWRSWFGELLRQRLRPIGWPVVQRTYLSHRPTSSTSLEPVEVDADDERAEYVIISVTCEAVPA